MSILIKGARILSMDRARDSKPFIADILIEADRISRVGERLEARDASVIDGRNRLVIPGLVNAHAHSSQNLTRGRFPSMPLEVFMLYCVPLDRAFSLPPRLVYLRSLLLGIEALKSGVTCLLDDVAELPTQDLAQLEAVFEAYDDLGIRANISGHVINKPYLDTLPYTDEIFPDELRREFHSVDPPTTESYLEFSEEAVRRFHGRAGRLRYVVAPSGPQRCTEDLLVAASEFSKRHDAPYHIHVLETKVQLVTAREFYGGSFVEYLHGLGALHERVTMAHTIWVTDDDIELMAESGCSIAHNPICNLRMGSGVAPLRKLLDANVNVALGTDQLNGNDRGPIFDVMHVAGLVHNLTSWEYPGWPSADEIFWAATSGGARSVGLADEIGSIEAGKCADLAILSLDSPRFTPLNDPVIHLVYAESGASVETVIVAGEVVVDRGALTRVDERAVIEEVRGRYPEYVAQQERMESMSRELEPYFAEMYRRCVAQEVELERVLTREGGLT
jgi:cytosine/adenosine deaminase-related metal-dependent hydrolase